MMVDANAPYQVALKKGWRLRVAGASQNKTLFVVQHVSVDHSKLLIDSCWLNDAKPHLLVDSSLSPTIRQLLDTHIPLKNYL